MIQWLNSNKIENPETDNKNERKKEWGGEREREREREREIRIESGSRGQMENASHVIASILVVGMVHGPLCVGLL